jgi:hypothetical protein
MNIIPYQLTTTNDLLTARAGLVCIAEVMKGIDFSGLVDRYFPAPQSNRGFKPCVFVNALMLMLHEGGRCLDDLRHIRDDEALRTLLGLPCIPESDSVGDWLRRCGQAGVSGATEVNRCLLAHTLTGIQSVTLDIDATLSASKNKNARWTYKKCTGYMPMVGHIAETGQVVATDFRAGNVAPATDNLAFIHQCEAALPEGVRLSALRGDAAAYQAAILDECIERERKFAIRVRMNKTLKQTIQAQKEAQWQSLVDANGQVIEGQWTTRLVHTMEKSQHAFSVVVQRGLVSGQQTLDLPSLVEEESIQCGHYIYRAIAVSHQPAMSDSQWVHWYNQRGEHSENRIKELKIDFAADRMPCRDFDANALYFSLCSLAFNLFAMMRRRMPPQFATAQAKTIRWRIYGLAAKVVRHGRTWYLKLKASHQALLQEILLALRPQFGQARAP